MSGELRMVPDIVKEEIIRWISLGWNYQIIHKLVKLRHSYNLTYDELREIKDDLLKDLTHRSI